LHMLYHVALTLTKLVEKQNQILFGRALLVAESEQQWNTSRLVKPVSLKSTYFLRLGPWKYHLCSLILGDGICNYWNVIQIVIAVFEKIAILYFWGLYEGFLLLKLVFSNSPSTDLWHIKLKLNSVALVR
jgi:hypothetical protein